MNKKKVLFIIPEYSHGGTNKSLENLLSLIDKQKYEISVYSLYEDGGLYYKDVLKPYIIKKSKLYNYVHDNFYTRKICGLWHKINKEADFSWLYKKEAKWLQDKYIFDVVIAYQEGTATEFASYFENVRKIAWIHCMYSRMASAGTPADIKMYQKFNNIICVSKTAVNDFISLIPECKGKALSIYNTLNVDKIKSMSKDIINDNIYNTRVSHFNIISIGRFAKGKQFEKIPQLSNEIKKLVTKRFIWYIIGAGCQMQEQTKEEIKKYNLEDVVKILEAKDNPYPYFKNADLHICTSDSESFSYTIFESKILHTPVVSNNFPVANEVVEKDCGWVCSLEEMPDLLVEIINDENGIYTKMKESISSYEYSNDDIIRKVEKLLDN